MDSTNTFIILSIVDDDTLRKEEKSLTYPSNDISEMIATCKEQMNANEKTTNEYETDENLAIEGTGIKRILYIKAGSLNQCVLPLSRPMSLPVLPIKMNL